PTTTHVSTHSLHAALPIFGPDNGLLAPAVAMLGGATRAVWLNDPEHHLESPGPLFDGRDVFAPVAARLCSGEVAFEDLGEAVDPDRKSTRLNSSHVKISYP